MSFMTLRLAAPGVKLIQTRTLAMANIVKSQLIRWREGLVEKLGGWQTFFAFPVLGPVRELWAWEDLNSQSHLAAAGDKGVTVITNNSVLTPGPLFQVRNPSAIETTASSSVYLVDDTGSDASAYETITLTTPYSVGGIAIYPGNFAISSVQSVDQYSIQGAIPALSTASSGTCATLTTTNGSATITVNLVAHGKAVGDNFSIVMPTVVGGITLSGFFTVQSVVDADNFTIFAPNTATAADTQNYGNVASPGIQLIQWIVATQQPPGGGWGDGGWGLGAWGESVPGPPVTGTVYTAVDWCMGNFGSILVLNPEDGPLFQWDPTIGIQNAQLIVPAPEKVHGMFIAMPEQMIVAFGASTQGVQDPMLVAWCDAGDFNTWIANTNNQAGTYRLTRGSRIVGGIQGPLQAMLWTDVGLWLMQYIGYPDVWGFLEISQGCGLIAKKAAVVVGTQVYWMSMDGFWTYAGGGAVRLPCDVWDVIHQNINMTFARNIRAAGNTPEDEIAWYFPSLSSTSGENDMYVKRNVLTGEWDYGALDVSEWIDQNVFGMPMSAMPDGLGDGDSLIMQHETSLDANGEGLAYSYRTGYFQLSEAEDFVFCDYMIPDFRWRRFNQANVVSAQVQLTFFVNDWPDDPNNPPIAFGPYTVTNATQAVDIRCRGRYFSLEIAGNDLGSFTRLGGLKFRIAPDGRNPN